MSPYVVKCSNLGLFIEGDDASCTFRDSDVFSPRGSRVLRRSRASSKCLSFVRASLCKPRVSPDIVKLLDVIDEPADAKEWGKVVNRKDMVFYKKQMPGCPVVLVKGSAILENIPLDTLWKAIANLDLRKTWDTVFSTMEVVEQNPDGTEVVYFVLKAPFGIQDRDFLQKRTIVHDYPNKGQTIIHFVSVENKLRPVVKKYIRAQTFISGYFFTELSKSPLKCKVDIVTQTDIKGLIPKAIVNMFAGSKSKAWVEGYKKGCLKLMKEKGLNM